MCSVHETEVTTGAGKTYPEVQYKYNRTRMVFLKATFIHRNDTSFHQMLGKPGLCPLLTTNSASNDHKGNHFEWISWKDSWQLPSKFLIRLLLSLLLDCDVVVNRNREFDLQYSSFLKVLKNDVRSWVCNGGCCLKFVFSVCSVLSPSELSAGQGCGRPYRSDKYGDKALIGWHCVCGGTLFPREWNTSILK